MLLQVNSARKPPIDPYGLDLRFCDGRLPPRTTFNRLRKNPRRRLEPACSAESFVALRSQRYGVAPSLLLVSTKHSGPIRTPRVFPQPVKAATPSWMAVENVRTSDSLLWFKVNS